MHTIAIITPQLDAYSETFIRAHIERLPASVRVLYGGYLPQYQDNGNPLLAPARLPGRLLRSIQRRLLRLPWNHFEKAAVRKFLCENRVDAVLAEYGPTGVAMLDICRQVGVPLVVHFHGYDAYHQETLAQEGQRYQELFEHAAAIIAVSHAMEEQLLRLGAARAKVHYNPCGVDPSAFQDARPGEVPPVFLAVGRFVDKKAPHLTLLAFKKASESLPEARLVMIGDGQLWEACKQLARALGIAEAVDFLGVRPHVEVAALMQRARAFVQHSVRTSYGDSEGTPVAVLEAGASGLPVVATRHAGIIDVVIEGETGLLVDEGDVAGMAEHMVCLAQDPALAAQLGRAARERMVEEFSMEKSIGRLWGIIEGVLASTGEWR